MPTLPDDGLLAMDEALARRARRGDGVAFAALTTRYWNAVHRIARNMTSNPGDAGDVTEQTFLRALPTSGPFDPDVPFRTSLYRLAIELSLTRFHAARPVERESLVGLLPKFDASGRLEPAGEDWSPFVETLSQRPGLASRIREALACLDDKDRASFVLREIEQLPLDEAAAVLRDPPETVRRRVHRACLMLTGYLGRLLGSPTPALS